jgi:hypothetical protein
MAFDWLHWVFGVGTSVRFRLPDGTRFVITRRPDPNTAEIKTYGSVVRETIRDFLRKLPEGVVSIENITLPSGGHNVVFEYHASGNKLAVVTERMNQGLDHLCEITPEGVIDVSTFKQPSIGEYFTTLGPEYLVTKHPVTEETNSGWLM